MSHSRNRREEGGRVGKLACWDGDRRHPVGKMTSCGRWRCWVGDRRRPGGRMESCGSYVRDYNSKKGKGR